MQVNRLELTNFRNYRAVSRELSPGINLILGENAQGKTNFLESIFFLSCVKAFHAKSEKELILFGESSARVCADITTAERSMNLRIDISQTVKRRIFENGIPQKKLLDYVGTLQTVVFSPDDLYIVKEGPAVRRRFLNIAISQLKPNYIQTLAEYNRLIEHKNQMLKKELEWAKDELLDAYNQRIAAYGAALIGYRQEFINSLYNFAHKIHSEMSGGREELSLRYVTDKFVVDPAASREEVADALYQHLVQRRVAELEAKSCLVGAHKDDFEILIDGKPAKFFASQGQIRTSVLALKMAERDVFHAVSGELPILLLDDVLSELDGNRQEYLLHKISRGQVIISSCHNHLFSNREGISAFSVNRGEIIEI